MSQPTMEDVAALAGVSRSLVSLVFQGSESVSAHRRAAVIEAAETLGYRPNRMARNLARGRTMTIGVVIDDLQNPWFAQTVEGLERAVAEAGYELLLSNGGRSAERAERAVTTLAGLRVDALVALSTRGPLDSLVELSRRVPCVLVGRHSPDGALDSIAIDDQRGCHLAIEHLVELGHRSIVHVDGGQGIGAEERRAGYAAAMAAFGAGPARIIAGEFTHAAGRAAAAEIVAGGTPPTAVFAANDLVATGLIAEWRERGMAVPHALSVVGFDDSTDVGLGETGLTTLRQPAAELGERAAELVLARIRGERTTVVRELVLPELIVRSTTAPPRSSPAAIKN